MRVKRNRFNCKLPLSYVDFIFVHILHGKFKKNPQSQKKQSKGLFIILKKLKRNRLCLAIMRKQRANHTDDRLTTRKGVMMCENY